MAIFKYKASNKNGKIIKGRVSAFDRKDAIRKVKGNGLAPLSVEDKTNSLELKILFLMNRVRAKDLVIFSRQFSVMISSNINLSESLQVLVDQTENIGLQMIISQISEDVESGSLLSESMGKFPHVFSDFYVNIVRSGESSGKLDEVLVYLADQIEKDYEMMSNIRGAMIYPIFIVCSLVAVGIILMVVVIPRIESIITETGAELPMSTKIVIGASNFLVGYWFLIVSAVVAIFLLSKIYGKVMRGKFSLDGLKLRLPIFGKLYQRVYLVRFTRSISTLLAGGISITKGLSIASDIVGNKVYKKLILDAAAAVEEGESISSVFAKSDQVPKMVPQMMNVGERVGKLDVVLDKITVFYTREVNNILSNLSTIIQPLVIVIMGVAVGIMVAAVIFPMYNVVTQF